jgi:hypothetical protein
MAYDTQTLPQACILAGVRLPHEIRWRMQGVNVQDQQIDCTAKADSTPAWAWNSIGQPAVAIDASANVVPVASS